MNNAVVDFAKKFLQLVENKKALVRLVVGGLDLNQRPSGYEPGVRIKFFK